MSELEFTYRENLIPRIRKLIKGYTVSSILKEYLQNADDAGATELTVTYDHRLHNQLKGTRFEKAIGPALLIENNSFFREKDFESIREISKEGKVDEASATGRFGEGFSCSFSVSDDPSFISSGKAYWFDVLAHSVKKDKSGNIGAWDDLSSDELQVWLDTFRDKPKQVFNPQKTIFRLPLRSSPSGISEEYFTYQDFIGWIESWTQSSHNILFLRNVQTITLDEIDIDGKKTCLAQIKTINDAKVRKVKSSIQADFLKYDNPQKLSEYWLSTEGELPNYAYIHELEISTAQETTTERWAVTNGLFRGDKNGLIKQSLDALNIKPIPQKVLPWCGCAIRLRDEKDGLNDEGKFYTFLPLEIKNPFPVHIHAWFDLDDKRTQITQQGGGTTSEILINWNRSLLTHGIGHAYAKLLGFIKEEISTERYYKLWPQRVDDPLLQCVTEGFYAYVRLTESIRTVQRENESWEKPNKSIFYLSQRNNPELVRAVSCAFRVATGGINSSIVAQLRKAGSELTELKPSHLLEYIVRGIDESSLPKPLEDIGLPLISDIKKYISVISFCVGKDKDFSIFEGIPLTLTSDQKIQPSSVNVMVEPTPEYRSVLAHKKHLILHSTCSGLIEADSVLPNNWFQKSLVNLLTLISENFGDFERSDRWVELLIDTIRAESEREVSACASVLSRMPIVETEKNEWETVSTKVEDYCPVLLPDRYSNKTNIFDSLNLNIVKVSKRELYNKLNNYKQVLLELSSYELAKHILKNREVGFCSDEEARVNVLEYLSMDIGWIDHLSPTELKFLLSIPFVLIESGSLVSLDSRRKVFLSSGFQPPDHITGLQGEYDLVADTSLAIRRLFKKLNLKEQTATHYITDVILPFIKNTDADEERTKAICWLVSEWENIKKNISEEECQQLCLKLSQTAIVPVAIDFTLVRPEDVYLPSFAKELPELFKDTAYFPAELPDLEDSWEKFLADVGARSSIISKHVRHVAYSFTEDENIGKGIEFWNYLIEKFQDIKDVKFGNKTLLESLSDLAIMPVSDSSKLLKPVGITPKFARSKNLITETNHNLLGGRYFSVHRSIKLTDKSEEGKNFIKQLGLITQLQWNEVMESFSQVLQLETNGKSKEERAIQNHAISFYRYVGRDNNAKQFIPEKVRTKSIRINSMWVDASDVFQNAVKVGGIFSWASLIGDGEDPLVKKGLERLGVKQRPTPAYMAEHLSDTRKYPINTRLDETSLFEVKLLLRWFSSHSVYERVNWPEFPLLGTDNLLHYPEDLYTYTSTNDIDAFEHAYEKNPKVFFVAQEFVMLARELELNDIKRDAVRYVNRDKSSSINDELDIELAQIERYIQSETFKDGLIRLIADKKSLNHEDVNHLKDEQLLPSNFIYCESLFLDSFIEEKWVYTDNTATSFLDEESSSLYLLAKADLEDMVDEVIVFIVDNHELEGKHQQSLSRILLNQMKPQEITELLNKKNIVSLPDDFEIYKEADIFEDDILIEHSEWDSHDHIEVSEVDFETNLDETNVSNDTAEIGAWDVAEESVEETMEHTEDASISPKVSNNAEKLTKSSRRLFGTLGIPKSSPPKQTQTKSVSDNNAERNEIPPPTSPKLGNTSLSASGERVKQPHQGNGYLRDKESDLSSMKNSKSRYPVYIYDSSYEDEIDEFSENNDRATVTGSKGEDFLIKNQNRYLTSSSNKLIKAKRNQEGYDIIEESEDGTVIRYIEVKTCEGKWGSRGVSLTLPQFEFAKQHDNWFLFVVENIETHPLQPNVHELPNPVLNINRFIFDSSWKQTVVSSVVKSSQESIEVIPKPGDVYYVPSLNEEIKVVSVQPRGKLTKIKGVIVSNGFDTKMKFDASWELR